MAIYRTRKLFARRFDAAKVTAELMKRGGKSQAEINKTVNKINAEAQALNQRGRNLAKNVNSTRAQINTVNKNQSELSNLIAKQEAASQRQAQTSSFWGKLTGKNRVAAKENQNLTNQVTEMTQKNGTLEQMATQRNNLNQTLAQDVENLNAFRNAKRGPSVNKQVDSMISGNTGGDKIFKTRRRLRGEQKQIKTAKERQARSQAAHAEHTGQGDTAINDAIIRESKGRTGEFTQQRGQKKPIARSETTLANKPQQTTTTTGGTKTNPATTQQPNTTQPGTGGGTSTTSTTTQSTTTQPQKGGSWWSKLSGAQQGGIIGTGGILGGAGLTGMIMGGGAAGGAATAAGAAAAPTLAAGYYYANKPREAAFSKNRNNINHVYRRPTILREH